MKRNLLLFLVITLLTLIGGFLRFKDNLKNPPSLNIDEVAYGYSAYSILKTGRDDNGVFMPIFFKSTGDYKNPVLIYSLVPSIAVFGLNEFGVRFTTALAGTLSIPVFFLLLFSLFKNLKISLIGAALLTVSPWHIFYSRFASDQLMGTFILMIGMYFFQKMMENGKTWILPCAFTLVLSMYTYHSERVFVPIFIASLFILNLQKLKSNRVIILAFAIISFILLLPLLYLSVFGAANARAAMVFLAQDIDYTRYVILDHLQRRGEIFLFFFFWIKRYLNYFQVDFLFFDGLNMTAKGTLGLGILYLFELPWLILGIIELIRKKISNKKIIILWILIGILPVSLTNNEHNTGRTLLILPALLSVVSLGVLNFLRLINKIKNKYFKTAFILTYIFFMAIVFIQAFLIFAVHFPRQKGENFMEGTKETVLYAIDNKDKYQEIVYDPYRGIEAQEIVNIPYMYILFYSKYDPELFLTEAKRYNDLLNFDKFTIRRIDWRTDRLKKNTLFIGSPWSLPLKDLKEGEILRKVYLANGNLALLIVSPK